MSLSYIASLLGNTACYVAFKRQSMNCAMSTIGQSCSFTPVSTEQDGRWLHEQTWQWLSAHLCQADTEKMTVNQLTLHFLGRHDWEIKIAASATYNVPHKPYICLCLIHASRAHMRTQWVTDPQQRSDHSWVLTFSHASNLFTKVQTGRTNLSLFLSREPLINSHADQNKTNKQTNIASC